MQKILILFSLIALTTAFSNPNLTEPTGGGALAKNPPFGLKFVPDPTKFIGQDGFDNSDIEYTYEDQVVDPRSVSDFRTTLLGVPVIESLGFWHLDWFIMPSWSSDMTFSVRIGFVFETESGDVESNYLLISRQEGRLDCDFRSILTNRKSSKLEKIICNRTPSVP